jgi:hypothetical protein
LKKTTTSIDRIVNGKIVGSVPQSELKNTDPPDHYRLKDGYVEIGMPSGGDVSWSRKLRIGARMGDTWEETTPTHHSKFLVKSVFMLGDRPCAVIVERSHIGFEGASSDAEITTWYVKGKGQYRFENASLTSSGEKQVNTRGELIYPK